MIASYIRGTGLTDQRVLDKPVKFPPWFNPSPQKEAHGDGIEATVNAENKPWKPRALLEPPPIIPVELPAEPREPLVRTGLSVPKIPTKGVGKEHFELPERARLKRA